MATTFSTLSTHCLTLTKTNHNYFARQINNPITFKQNFKKYLQKETYVNIFFPSQLKLPQIITNPFTTILFSSFGAMYGAKMSVREPSDGIWTLADYLSRTTPETSCFCIDPNLFSLPQLVKQLRLFIPDPTRLVFGFSIIPENLKNDLEFIKYLNKHFPKARLIVGGIGSESLLDLPATNGEFGIQHVLPITAVISGPAIKEISQILKQLYQNPQTASEELFNIPNIMHQSTTQKTWREILKQVQKSRLSAQKYFVPYNQDGRYFFPKSYSSLCQVTNHSNEVKLILSDNRCQQRCWFCSTPKDWRFNSKESEMEYIRRVAAGSSAIAFNNNDLDYDAEKTIWICQQMAQDPRLRQPKHGKISVYKHNSKLINAFKAANFVRLAIGVETFNAKHRAYLKNPKFSNNYHLKMTLIDLIKNGIQPEINLILFHPKETEKSLKQNIVQALYWISKGATFNVTLGVHAMPNSYKMKQLLSDLKKYHLKPKKIRKEMENTVELDLLPGTNNTALMFPLQFLNAESRLQKLKHQIRQQRNELISQLPATTHKILSHNHVPIYSYTAIILLAKEMGVLSKNTNIIQTIASYSNNFSKSTYVAI